MALTVEKALVALAKFAPVRRTDSGSFFAVSASWEVSFLVNGRHEAGATICCIRARRLTDRDDSQADYCAGSFFPSIPAAIRWARQSIAQDAADAPIFARCAAVGGAR